METVKMLICEYKGYTIKVAKDEFGFGVAAAHKDGECVAVAREELCHYSLAVMALKEHLDGLTPERT